MLVFVRAMRPELERLHRVANTFWIIGKERRIEQDVNDDENGKGQQRNRRKGNRSTKALDRLRHPFIQTQFVLLPDQLVSQPEISTRGDQRDQKHWPIN